MKKKRDSHIQQKIAELKIRDNIRERAKIYDESLQCDDPRFQGSVHIVHLDGSTHFYENAFLMRSDKCIVVFAEHHSPSVFFIDDLFRWHRYTANTSEHEQLP